MAGARMYNFCALIRFTNAMVSQPVIALIHAYAMDAYNANIAEMLVIMNLGIQVVSFGMGYGILNWALVDQYYFGDA